MADTRHKKSSGTSDTSISESERSFVSAESENTSTTGPLTGQSESAPPIAPTTQQGDSDISSASSSFEQPTPLARRTTRSSSGTKPSTPNTASAGPYFSLPSNPPNSDPRSPPYKRAPASRSSHGIETRSGPPPALSTQRSYNSESPWRRASPAETPSPYNHSNRAEEPASSSVSTSRRKSDTFEEPRRERMNANRRSSGAARLPRRDTNQPVDDDDQDSTIRFNGRHAASHSAEARQSKDGGDLFLNLARSDALSEKASDLQTNSERRRSKGFDTATTPRPSSSGRPNSSGDRFFNRLSPPHLGVNAGRSDKIDVFASLASLRADLKRDRPYAASAHPLDQRHSLHHTSSDARSSLSRMNEEESQSGIYGRRRSIHTSMSKYNSSPLTQRPDSMRGEELSPKGGNDDGTESTLSTTAPSTVWDELDDLKARIRKIEMTGGVPASGNAAFSTIERDRPVTASTTMTTASISPKRHLKAAVSTEASSKPEDGTGPSQSVLQSALVRTKPLISPSLFRSLEATVEDTISLAAMAGGKGYQSSQSAHNPTAVTDRQLRRKAENLCRSLTEFCIALAETKDGPQPTSSSPQWGKIATTLDQSPMQSPVEEESTRNDPDLKASSRVLSRLEARRTSLRGVADLASISGPSFSSYASPVSSVDPQNKAGSLERSNTVRAVRNNDAEYKLDNRPLSRAATDAGHHKRSPHARSSREYTSQHPLPSPPKESGLVPSSDPRRSSHFSSAQSNISSVRMADRKHSDRSTPPTADSAHLAEIRQRRLASMIYGSSPSASVSARRAQQVGAESG